MGRTRMLEEPAAAPRVEALLDAIANGVSIRGACRVSGISFQTLRNWIEAAETDEPDETYLAFLERYERARAKREIDRIRVIEKAGETDWRALAFLMERQEPVDYGARQFIEQETTHTIKALEITGAPLPELEP